MSCEFNQNIKCTCTYACDKHGKCCECVAYHKRKNEFPGCFFTEKAEKSYDRSWAALVKDRNS